MAMKFWRNAAALPMVFHPKTTHCGNHSTPKDVKNEGRPGKVYENKGPMDKMSETISDSYARLERFLQKIGVSSSPNSSRVTRTYRRPTTLTTRMRARTVLTRSAIPTIYRIAAPGVSKWRSFSTPMPSGRLTLPTELTVLETPDAIPSLDPELTTGISLCSRTSRFENEEEGSSAWRPLTCLHEGEVFDPAAAPATAFLSVYGLVQQSNRPRGHLPRRRLL